MHNATGGNSGLVSGITTAVTYALLALLPALFLGHHRRKARGMPPETRSSYTETFSAAQWTYGVALFNCLMGAGIMCLSIPHPNGTVFYCILGGLFVALGGGCMLMFWRAELVITESEIRYRIALENWTVSRAEIRRMRLSQNLPPSIVIATEANPRRLILLVFRDTARIVSLLGLR